MNQTEMLRYALTLEKAHLALLNDKDMIDFWGSEAEVAMGNDVVDFCQKAELELEWDTRAAADEIAISNIAQIEEALTNSNVYHLLYGRFAGAEEFIDPAFRDFPLDSHCGRACTEVVESWDHIQALFPDFRDKLRAIVIDQCAVICFG